MFSFGTIAKAAVKVVGKTTFFITRHRSEILTGIGTVGVVVSTVMACKATLKVEEVLEKAKTEIDIIHESREILPDKYSEEMSKKDLTVVYTRTTVSIAKLYAPAVAICLFSLGCIWGGHYILRKENAAISAAYLALSESFQQYRKKVEAKIGPEQEKELYLGLAEEPAITIDENGNIVEEGTALVVNGKSASMYARYFCFDVGEGRNPNYSDNPDQNLMFLRSQQNRANDKLRSRGYIFLNEVYEMLGLKGSQAGCVVGWVYGHGDSSVDFNIYNCKLGNARAVNGLYPSFMLDFNVDGMINDIFNQEAFNKKMGRNVRRCKVGAEIHESILKGEFVSGVSDR